ncbi:delta-60 repeat domain-containing protein [Gammaproteobacteria bacterium AB-CW1]|uniref:Delta-60 repeat domain-containing protein n=1 Tax=Natronospira elongata TaxID=3110268 RepID=A0AAP6MK27_9GAMM|nr:delta-60 repeat domain-containing protein [Gammaproteobacteria bacterium AB-CW1]
MEFEVKDGAAPKKACSFHKRSAAALALLAGFGLSACLADGEGDPGDAVGEEPDFFTVGGELQGLSDDSVDLLLNDEHTLTLSENGAFNFEEEIEDGSDYEVVVDGQPSGQFCEVSNGSGVVAGSDVTDLQVNCDSLALNASNAEGAVHLDWDLAGPVDILYSTDYECDWSNVQACENGGTVVDVEGGEHSLSVSEDDLELNAAYTFVKRVAGETSAPVVATPASFQLSGPVHDTVILSEHVIVGGEFGMYGDQSIGLSFVRPDLDGAPTTGPIVQLDASVLSKASRVIEDPEGGWFVAGHFETVQGVDKPLVARLNPDGSLDEDWGAEFSGSFALDMVMYEDRLYVTGDFGEVDGDDSHANLVALNLDGTVDTDFSPESPNDRAFRILIEDDRLYLAGRFSDYGPNDQQGIAALDSQTGDVIEDFEASLNDGAFDLFVDSERLIVAGQFSEANGEPYEGVAIFNLSDGSLDSDFENPEVSGSAIGVHAWNDYLFVGGLFNEVAGVSRMGFAALDREDGSVDPDWDAQTDEEVYRITVHEGQLYIAGEFRQVADSTVHAFARLDPDTAALDESWVPVVEHQGSFAYGWSIDFFDGYAALGGYVQAAGGHRVDHLAAFEIESGDLEVDWQAQVDGPVYALDVDNSNGHLYVGGSFSTAGADGEERGNAAAFDSQTGELEGWDPGTDDTVHDLLFSGNGVYLAGAFTTLDFPGVGTADRQRMALVDPDLGIWDADTGDPELNDVAYSLGHYTGISDAVVVGGRFTQSAGDDVDHYHGFGDTDFSNTFSLTEFNGNVRAVWIDQDDENLSFVGGQFTQAQGDPHEYFVWNPDSYNPEDDAPQPDGTVWAIDYRLDSERLLIGGDFNEINVSNRHGFAAFDFDGDDFTLKDNTPGFDGRVHAIAQTDTLIAVAGEFVQVGDYRQRYIALLDADTFEPIWSAPEAAESISETKMVEPSRQAADADGDLIRSSIE